MTPLEKYNYFSDLHNPGNCFIMANAWNAGSAAILQQAGIKAIGTTSAGMAYAHAFPDSQGIYSMEMAIAETTEIADAVNLPVSVDSENCYADDPENVAINITKLAATGVAGISIEDLGPDTPQYDLKLAIERVAAAKEAIDNLETPVWLTARAECYLINHPEPFAEAVKRLNSFRAAGADCLYAPGIRDIKTIAELVKEVDGPINVVMGLSGKPIHFDELAEVGVARISIGGSLARATLGLIQKAAREMLDQGSFDFAAGQIPDADLCRFFEK
jgi:2-methylisocitrate lyase-like PEP mutase family enzyme